MKLLMIAACMVATTAHAETVMDARLEMMKLTFACSNKSQNSIYRAAKDAAMRQSQRDLPGTDRRGDVLALDTALANGSIAMPQSFEKKNCNAMIERARLAIDAMQ